MEYWNSFFSVLLVLKLESGTSSDAEYYWREYTGVIPSDALPGGKDADGQNTYIGQAYIHTHGVFVAQFFSGKKEVSVPAHGAARKADNDIKILCTKDADNFEWITTSNVNFLANTTNQHPVPGGYDAPSNAVVYIGRLFHQNVLKVGQIGAKAGNNFFYFLHNNAELKATLFQVLLYREQPNFDIGVRTKRTD